MLSQRRPERLDRVGTAHWPRRSKSVSTGGDGARRRACVATVWGDRGGHRTLHIRRISASGLVRWRWWQGAELAEVRVPSPSVGVDPIDTRATLAGASGCVPCASFGPGARGHGRATGSTFGTTISDSIDRLGGIPKLRMRVRFSSSAPTGPIPLQAGDRADQRPRIRRRARLHPRPLSRAGGRSRRYGPGGPCARCRTGRSR